MSCSFMHQSIKISAPRRPSVCGDLAGNELINSFLSPYFSALGHISKANDVKSPHTPGVGGGGGEVHYHFV